MKGYVSLVVSYLVLTWPLRNFDEAMKLTAKAKASFPSDEGDLYMRASRLIRESVECGVTSMRAHVEVDTIVKFSCLDIAVRVRQEWESICDIHLCGMSAHRT